MELTGTIYSIGGVSNVSASFRKRPFILEYRNEGDKWKQYAQLEFTQADVLTINDYKVGDKVRVTFEVTGRMYNKMGEEKNFTSLRATAIVLEEAFVSPSTSRRLKTDTQPMGPISDPRLLEDDMGTAQPPEVPIDDLPWK